MTAAVASVDIEQPVLPKYAFSRPDNHSYTNDVAREAEACQAAAPLENRIRRIIIHLPGVGVRKAGRCLHCETPAACTFVYKRYCPNARSRERNGREMTQPTIRLTVNGKNHDV